MIEKVDCDVEMANRILMRDLDLDTNVVEQVEGKAYTLGRKFYKLPNWMKEGELITQYSRHGIVVQSKVLGVIRSGGARFRDNVYCGKSPPTKGNLLVQFSVLNMGKIEHYYGSVATWRKLCNAENISGFVTVRELMFTRNHKGLEWFQLGMGYANSFENVEYKGEESGWWK